MLFVQLLIVIALCGAVIYSVPLCRYEASDKADLWSALLESDFHSQYAQDHAWWMDSLCSTGAVPTASVDTTDLEVLRFALFDAATLCYPPRKRVSQLNFCIR